MIFLAEDLYCCIELKSEFRIGAHGWLGRPSAPPSEMGSARGNDALRIA